MAAQIIDGVALSRQIRQQLAVRAATLAARGHTPGLAVILVGDDPASAVYVRNKRLACDECGIVSVSQDGATWYSFTNDPNFMADDPGFIKLAADADDGPFCDGFAPTLGRVYDPCHADASIGEWNLWWAEPTNPTLPVDPNLSFETLAGRSVARVAQTYGDSAGGTGYDIARLDLPNRAVKAITIRPEVGEFSLPNLDQRLRRYVAPGQLHRVGFLPELAKPFERAGNLFAGHVQVDRTGRRCPHCQFIHRLGPTGCRSCRSC